GEVEFFCDIALASFKGRIALGTDDYVPYIRYPDMTIGTGETPSQDLSFFLNDVTEKRINTLLSDMISGTFQVVRINLNNFIPDAPELCSPEEHLFPSPDPTFSCSDLSRIKNDLGVELFQGIQVARRFELFGICRISVKDYMFG